jgi:hypothetical protein
VMLGASALFILQRCAVSRRRSAGVLVG